MLRLCRSLIIPAVMAVAFASSVCNAVRALPWVSLELPAPEPIGPLLRLQRLRRAGCAAGGLAVCCGYVGICVSWHGSLLEGVREPSFPTMILFTRSIFRPCLHPIHILFRTADLDWLDGRHDVPKKKLGPILFQSAFCMQLS